MSSKRRRHKGGWVKLWRKALLGDIGESYLRLGLFNALVCMANIQASTVTWRGKPRKLERGELVTSLGELADLGDVDKKTVSKHLNYLRMRGTIEIEKSVTGTLIKIVNYEQYQGVDAEGSTSRPRGMDQGVHEVWNEAWIHNEEVKKKRRKELKELCGLSLEDAFEKAYRSYPLSLGKGEGRRRFKVQIKTDQDYQDFLKSIDHYKAFLEKPENSWRKPKQFDSFLGTKSSGFFWREWLDPNAGRCDLERAAQDDEIPFAEYMRNKEASGDL